MIAAWLGQGHRRSHSARHRSNYSLSGHHSPHKYPQLATSFLPPTNRRMCVFVAKNRNFINLIALIQLSILSKRAIKYLNQLNQLNKLYQRHSRFSMNFYWFTHRHHSSNKHWLFDRKRTYFGLCVYIFILHWKFLGWMSGGTLHSDFADVYIFDCLNSNYIAGSCFR